MSWHHSYFCISAFVFVFLYLRGFNFQSPRYLLPLHHIHFCTSVIARHQHSVTEVSFVIASSSFLILLFFVGNDISNVWCMFGLIFQTQVSNFCLTSRRTGELVLARTRQNLISTLHHRLKNIAIFIIDLITRLEVKLVVVEFN